MTVTINGTTGIAGVDGSAATPAVQGADTNTGMFFPAADTIAFTEGGTERMRINSSGQVGIGTTTPNANLEVNGGAASSTIKINNSSYPTTGLDITKFAVNADAIINLVDSGNLRLYTANTERVRIESSGQVGVGTTTPTCALDVIGGIQTSRTTVTSPAATDGNIFSGTYTPTLTNSTNVAASTPVECFYTRVGNVVTVTGQVSIDVTTTLTDSVLLMSLPIASTFTVGRNCGGTGASSTSGTYGTETIAIIANVAGGSAEFRLRPASVANLDYRFSFAYRVL
jgi:hypothetical protein